MDAIAASLQRLTKVISSNKQKKSNVSEDVTEKITKNLTLWNTMMSGLGETTNLDISAITEKSEFYASHSGSQSVFSHTQSLNHSKSIFNSNFLVSVKEDARDLLERYS